LDQLYNPHGIVVDAHKTIYVADWFNHRIVRWKCDATAGEVIVGGNELHNHNDQLKLPTDVAIDRQTGSLIIADGGNMRVMKCSDQSPTDQTILLDNIRCYGLAIARNGCIYISDWTTNNVQRWSKGETETTLVAGEDGQNNQLSYPTYLFIDDDESLYVSDKHNHRVVKWSKGTNNAVVVAGGNGQGNALNQLRKPHGVFVDRWGRLFVADSGNDRVVCWCKGSSAGSVVVGTNQWGKEVSPLWYPVGLTFDADGNLYVADCYNHRVQKFEVLPSWRCAIQ
jgi:DNA-binding beta-propeller fold protein YncE